MFDSALKWAMQPQALLIVRDAPMPPEDARLLDRLQTQLGYHVEVMRGAYCGAVRGLVSAAARAVQEMMVVEAASGAAPGHGAAPAVARKNRIAVARARFPIRDHVLQHALERVPAWHAGLRKNIERFAHERDD